ncbi:hypothetical protein M0L20_13620 [Spirosoma sp. RP8]|uniref:Uncharacterized protein n=1 Tax=Spirosoma liriopis TaxID=2937440 RepID=A0ABT0HL48_9BACT|nr:hypothetical protein [Spirosoma liriopis]MCK8492901.1 hypothetical protein [Spirosoma liriopis]
MSSKTNFFQRNEGATEAEYAQFSTSVGQKIDTSHKHQQLLRFAMQFIPETVIPDFFEAHEADDLLRTTSEHPLELSRIYLTLLSEERCDYSKEGAINDCLRPFPKTDFERWGDKNWLSDVSNAWFDKEGSPLDVQAMEISEYYNGEVTENDLVEYVRAWKPGKYRSVQKRQLDELETRWLDLFGFKISKRYAESLTGLVDESKPEEIVVPF